MIHDWDFCDHVIFLVKLVLKSNPYPKIFDFPVISLNVIQNDHYLMGVQIGSKSITRYTVNQSSLDRVPVAYNQAYNKEFSLFK